MAESGFVIGEHTYPFPTSFRLCDPVLVSQLTGMSWMEFVELLEDSDQQDPATMAGMIGVAVWQKNPRWSRERVVRYVENISMENVEVVSEDEDDDDGDAVPPPGEAEPSASGGSHAASKTERNILSDNPEIPFSTGESESATTSPESLRVA